MRSNPFALARAQGIRIRAERLKAELKAGHEAAREDYLGNEIKPLPAGAKTPKALIRYENYAPIAVRKAALQAEALYKAQGIQRHKTGRPSGPNSTRLAGVFLTAAPDQRPRKHRATGKSRGRPGVGDVGLARAVYVLMKRPGIAKDTAIKALAQWLVKTERVTFKAARERVYRALSH